MAEGPASDHGRKSLEKSTLFGALDEKVRREIAAYAKPRRYAAGEPICRLDDHGDSMMAVVVGTVRISLPALKGREIILADLQPGELFGEIALLDGKPRSANATAHTNCELMVLERRDVMPFLERNPSACIKLMEILCSRIRRSDERMSDIAFYDLPVRLAKTLLHYPPPRPRNEETFALPDRAGGNGWRNAGERQPLPSRLATPRHSRIEGSMDNHSQA